MAKKRKSTPHAPSKLAKAKALARRLAPRVIFLILASTAAVLLSSSIRTSGEHIGCVKGTTALAEIVFEGREINPDKVKAFCKDVLSH